MSSDSDSVIRTLVKGGGILFIGFVLELSLSFGAKLLMARLLEKTSYGSVSLGIVLAANVSTILLFGLNIGVARYLPRVNGSAKERGLIRTAFVSTVPVAVTVAAIIYILSDPIAIVVFDDPSIASELTIFALAIPFAVLMKLGVGVVQGKKLALPKVLIRQIAQPVSRFVFITLALWFGLASMGVSWAYVASYAVAAFLAMYFVVRYVSLPGTGPSTQMRGELFSFSAPLAVSSVTMLVFSGIGIDTLMIGYFGTTEAVADYNVVFPLASVLTLVFTSFSFIFMPVLSELHAEERGDELRRLYTVVTKWIFLGTLPLFLLFVFFPNEAISYTFGSNYSEAGTALTVLAVGFFSHTLVGPNESTLNSIGATKHVMYDNITAAVVNIMINFLLIPTYGIIGAAVGTTVAYIILNSLYSYHVFVLTGVHPFSMAMLKPGIGGIVIGLVVYFIVTSAFQITPLVLVAASLVYAIFYTVAVLLLGGVEREEVMLVLSFEERFGVDLGPLKRVVNRLL
ncbi:hypothetical protein DJ83_07385 [Halorubrum ezzemoulense]|uniref:Uncharacterized protein n=1 Tax=Halorubrum ezzemoulense TaxID=337243 RepID=A0A256IYL4_HALEZ|nr:flippase [Halorubrum ezzemoulense]OYR61625.1 hypothetical protein DJ83_07385 [Halorubrum ezzemoulense]OYR74049.1 hypothetical protein DJ76_07335 [Halorubrum ezzemoulense]